LPARAFGFCRAKRGGQFRSKKVRASFSNCDQVKLFENSEAIGCSLAPLAISAECAAVPVRALDEIATGSPLRKIYNFYQIIMVMTDKKVVAKTIQTYEETAEDYYKTHFDINEIKNIADFFIQNLKGQKILDIGCGPGRDTKYFSENGLDVTGIEKRNYTFIFHARHANREPGPRIVL